MSDDSSTDDDELTSNKAKNNGLSVLFSMAVYVIASSASFIILEVVMRIECLYLY